MKKLFRLAVAGIFAAAFHAPALAQSGPWPLTWRGIDGVLFAAGFPGTGWCAKVANAIAALPSSGGTIVVDKLAGNGTCASVPTTVTNLTLQWADNATYVLSGTLNQLSGDCFRGVRTGIGLSSTVYQGTRLQWTGAASGTEINIQNAPETCMSDLWIDGNNGLGGIGVHYWSQNTPPTSHGNFSNLFIQGFHHDITIGEDSNSFPGSAACNLNVSQAGCYEADTFTFDHVVLYGPATPDTTSECIHMNSANAAQQATFDHIHVALCNIGAHVVSSNGGWTLSNMTGGSWVGSVPTAIQIDPSVQGGQYALINDEIEGSPTYTVHDSACGVTISGRYDRVVAAAGTILVDGCQNVVSTGTSGTAHVSGTANVISLNESNWSTLTGSGIAFQPAIVSGGGSYVVGEILTATDGTCTQEPEVQVQAVTAGVITSIFAYAPGVCSALPGGSSWTSTGSGTGAQLTLTSKSPELSTNFNGALTQADEVHTLNRLFAAPSGLSNPSTSAAGDVIAARTSTDGRVHFGTDNNAVIVRNSAGQLSNAKGWGITHVTDFGTAPTIGSGFCTSPTVPANNGTAVFTINVGTGCATGTGVVSMPTATGGYGCSVNTTSPDTHVVRVTANSTTSVSVKDYSTTTGSGQNFADNQVLTFSCRAF